MDEAKSVLNLSPQQLTFYRLAKTIMVLLDRHVAYRAVNDPHMLRQLVQHATETREIIDEDERDAEVFGWWSNPHLGLRLAVEVYRSERDAFFKGASQRLKDLERQEGDKRNPT